MDEAFLYTQRMDSVARVEKWKFEVRVFGVERNERKGNGNGNLEFGYLRVTENGARSRRIPMIAKRIII